MGTSTSATLSSSIQLVFLFSTRFLFFFECGKINALCSDVYSFVVEMCRVWRQHIILWLDSVPLIEFILLVLLLNCFFFFVFFSVLFFFETILILIFFSTWIGEEITTGRLIVSGLFFYRKLTFLNFVVVFVLCRSIWKKWIYRGFFCFFFLQQSQETKPDTRTALNGSMWNMKTAFPAHMNKVFISFFGWS